ncbi:Cation/acetate symporter ActP [Thalassoglobus neptunius]|uniref:Cation/acetate symporter ActP n=1 Tax=Thalassoglobus neptunius TaxID=1938619 RepID=A0A5C5X4H9_9PLAN|nr:cation acetate symporter [Thalassoglobus neptunius]TWT57628.1 Cation/acetate symporter ActP [Thalassoglobus neptunius]
MIYEPSTIAVVAFLAFVGGTMGLSFYLAGRAKSSAGYFAAHGQIPWFINGVAFAGDYLSAASFLGICGMIAFYGYDGFLYSIGFLAGWIVALFVVAEPLKRMGKYTFADALDSTFQSRGIQCVVGISTLIVSIFYLIPQMVGAGVLIQPLLGLPHWVGVVLVGAAVVAIVVSAGMVSTTYVQFLKGSLLVLFSLILVIMILAKGLNVEEGGMDGYKFQTIGPITEAELKSAESESHTLPGVSGTILPADGEWAEKPYVRVEQPDGGQKIFSIKKDSEDASKVFLVEGQTVTSTPDGQLLVNGLPKGSEKGEPELHPVGYISRLPDDETSTGALGPVSFFQKFHGSEVILWGKTTVAEENGDVTTIYYQKPTSGSEVLMPGNHPKFAGIRGDKFVEKLNFISLMLALFCGTASLPHILIRYYTVKDGESARKSTIVGIGAIGFFYILTLYLGLGAMVSGAMDVTDSNMAAPLLAKSMNVWLFAIISAIAFTTVLGTVSGLILASAGAVTRDLLMNVGQVDLNDSQQVRVAKITSVVVGVIAIVLGILFEGLNVGYLVGWAFSIAASANLPSLVMLLFWNKTTKEGVIAAVSVGMVSSLGWILLSGDTFDAVYKIPGHLGYVPFSQPGIVTIPLGFLTLVGVSLLTQPKASETPEPNPA